MHIRFVLSTPKDNRLKSELLYLHNTEAVFGKRSGSNSKGKDKRRQSGKQIEEKRKDGCFLDSYLHNVTHPSIHG